MVKLINKRTGSSFWVTDERVEEYKAAGHKLAASPSAVQKPKEEPVEAKEEAKEEKPVKKIDQKVVKHAVKKK